ncbi:MAG TPA: hypothetical protein VNT28_00915 [Candidatus Limnocylindrales bacterium]|jgi:exopolyphosphatase / guanosine-5'-triphosphate,3'-diphosphate pyrophosphatase|nr:hypothetical protein [Candidatus Limnocylindrales bacterium]
MGDGSRVGAAIDVGSNSVHLLVSRLRDGRLETLRDESVLLGLGDVVDRTGSLEGEDRSALLRALAGFVAVARAMRAADIILVGTEPLRRAADTAELVADVERELGLRLHVVTARDEGLLTYLGVTAGQPPRGSLLVTDIGGGSSEVVLAEAGRPVDVVSLPSGSARLSRGIVEHDPPTAQEIDALLAAAHRLCAPLPDARPAGAVFVGGTATNLARLAELRRDGLALAYRVLVTLDAQALSRRYGVNLRRARQLAAGAALVDALLARYGLESAEVSQASLRDGAIIAAGRLGPSWLERLAAHVGGR